MFHSRFFLNTPSLVDELKDLSFMSDGKQILVSGNGTYCITSMRDKLDGTLYTVFKIHDQCWAFGGGSLHETTLPVGRYEKIGQVFYILDDVNPGKYFFSRAPVEAVEHRWFEPVSYIQAYKLKGEGEGIICKIGDLQYKIKRSWTIDVAVRRADDNVVYTDAGDFSRHRVNAKIGQIVECDIRSMNCVRVRHDKLRQENFYPLLNARSSDQMIVMMRKAEYFVKVKQGNLLPFPHLVSIAGSGALVTAHDLYISFMQDKCEHDFVATLNKSGVVIDGKRVVSHGVVQYSTNMKYNIDCRQETKDMLITNREKLAVYKHILNSDIDPLDLNAAYNYYREQDSTQYMKWSGVSAKNRMESYQKKKPFRKKPLSGYDVEQSWVDIGCGDGAITHAMGIPEVNLLNVDVVDRRYYQKSAEFKLFSEFGSGSKKYQNFLLNHSLHHMTDVEIGDCFKKIFQTAALGARIYLREHSVDSSNYNHIKALHVAYLLKEIPRYHGKEEFFSILDDEMGMLNLKDKSTWISTFVLAGFRLVVAGDPISHDNVFVSVFEVG